jgi:hypothetical protein
MRWTGHDNDGQPQRWDTGDAPEPAVGEPTDTFHTVDGRFHVVVAKQGQSEALRRQAAALLDLGAVYPGLDAALLLPRGQGEMPRCFLVVDAHGGSLEGWLGSGTARTPTHLDRLRVAESCCQSVVDLHWSDRERARRVTWRVAGRDRAGPLVHRQIHPRWFRVRCEGDEFSVRLGGFRPVRNGDEGTLTLPVRDLIQGYAPPDQLQAAEDGACSVVPDVSWDVHALGATLVAVLVGEDARGRRALVEALTEVLGRADLAAALAEDLAWALESTPRDRLGDARVLLRRVRLVRAAWERDSPEREERDLLERGEADLAGAGDAAGRQRAVDGGLGASPPPTRGPHWGRWSVAALVLVTALLVGLLGAMWLTRP